MFKQCLADTDDFVYFFCAHHFGNLPVQHIRLQAGLEYIRQYKCLFFRADFAGSKI